MKTFIMVIVLSSFSNLALAQTAAFDPRLRAENNAAPTCPFKAAADGNLAGNKGVYTYAQQKAPTHGNALSTDRNSSVQSP